MSDKKLSMVMVEDIGKCACAIFQNKSFIGKTVGVSSENLTCEEIASVFSKVCGQKVTYHAVSPEVYASFGFPGAEELTNMFRFYAENEEEYVEYRTIPEKIMADMGSVT
eukprot:5239462-Ditylum_brightwellii.AAC.1